MQRSGDLSRRSVLSLAVFWLLIACAGADEDDEGGREVGLLNACHLFAVLSVFEMCLDWCVVSPQHATVTCGSAIKIQHVGTGYRIHSVASHFSLLTGMWRRP
jgi:hypothetical protein